MVKNTLKTSMANDQLKASKFSTSVDKCEERGCFYTSIPRVIKCKGIQGQELTSLNLDKRARCKNYGGAKVVRLTSWEMQFAYIALLMGQSLEAFTQWKSLVSLLFGCTEAGQERLLLDDSWFSADSLLHRFCNVAIYYTPFIPKRVFTFRFRRVVTYMGGKLTYPYLFSRKRNTSHSFWDEESN